VPPDRIENNSVSTSRFEKNLMFFMGMGSLISCRCSRPRRICPRTSDPAGPGVLWLVGNILHRNKPAEDKDHLTLTKALRRIDMASVVFFIGILLAVGTLSANGMLPAFARWLDARLGNQALIVVLIALPPPSSTTSPWWPLPWACIRLPGSRRIPFSGNSWPTGAGTGGSILIIGSARAWRHGA